jgi:uncharacterized protein YdeI (BOF family)
MKKSILTALCMFLISTGCFAEESISYTISLTIPKIREHSQYTAPDTEKKTAKDDSAEDSKSYPWPEPVVIVKTIVSQP